MRPLALFALIAFTVCAGTDARAVPISKLEVTKVEGQKKSYTTRMQGTLNGKPVTVHLQGPTRVSWKRWPAEVRIGPRTNSWVNTGMTKLTRREVERLVKTLDKQSSSSAALRPRGRAFLREVSGNIRSLILE